MCNGPLFQKILIFTIPLMLSGVLQLLFNAADMVVVGRFAGSEALAAVGSTSALINLLINVFMGLSIGANVIVARYYGAGKKQEVSQTVHTAITLSLICGILLIGIGVAFSKPLLIWMGTPKDVITHAVLYIRIYFMGMPVMLLYNFGSAILRAIGDTRRPLYFLSVAGVVNVIFNLIFVIVFDLGVAGVAIATDISQLISAILIVRCLMKNDGAVKLHLDQLRIHRDKMMQMIRTGLPAGVQGAIFSLSNVLIQSSVNSFGSVAMAGNTAASNLEGFVYTSMNAFSQTSLSFTSQNLGGGKWKRIAKVAIYCVASVTVTGLVLGWSAYGTASCLLRLYSDQTTVITYGILRMQIICTSYCLCGIMDVMVGCIRGLGYSILPMIVSLIGACGFRVFWIFTIFRAQHSLTCLYISYPISWSLTITAHVICYVLIRKKRKII